MQHASCFVRLSGDLGTDIARAPVTPAEVVLLRAIHGPEAVSRVELIPGSSNDKTPHADELERLRMHYTAMTEDGAKVIDKVFPGHAPQLPTTFDEIGITVGVNEGKAPRTAKGKKAAAENDAKAKANSDDGKSDVDQSDED